MPQNLQFMPMERSHLPGGLQLSRAAGWPHRAEDWEALFEVSKGVVALQDGRVVATGFCTLYEGNVRFNMIIVDETLRGKGIGKKLFSELVALAASRPTALVATEDGFPLYRKFGFEPAGEIEQYQGTVVSIPLPECHISKASASDFPTIAKMDRAATGIDRSALLQAFSRDGQVFIADGGYAILRDFGRGKVIGPVVAKRLETARDLLFAAASGLEGTFLRVDTDPALGLTETIRSMGLSKVGGGTVMFAGPPPVPHEYITFALASQALG